MEQVVDTTGINMITGLIFIVVMGGISYVLYKSVKSKMDLGNLLVEYMTHQEIFMTAAIVFALMLAEAAFVSTFHPEDIMDQIPLVPRFIGHFGVNFASYVQTINVPKKWADVIECIPPINADDRKKHFERMKKMGITRGRATALFLYAIVSTIIAYSLPIVNVYILASGLGQTEQLFLFWNNIWYDMSDVFANYPVANLHITKIPEGIEVLGSTYSPYGDMRYPLQIVIVMLTVHLALATMKGFSSVVIGYKTTGVIIDRSVPEPTNRSSSEKQRFTKDSILSNIEEPTKFLLSFYGYSSDDLDEKIDECSDKIMDMDEQARGLLAQKMATLCHSVDKLIKSKSTIGIDKYRDEARRARTEIRKFFLAPHKNGTGFGITLSKQFSQDAGDND